MGKHYYDDRFKVTGVFDNRTPAPTSTGNLPCQDTLNFKSTTKRLTFINNRSNLPKSLVAYPVLKDGGNTDLYKNPKPMPTEGVKKSTGGPSEYYDMPFSDWVTVNDMAEHLAEHKWGKYGIHLKDIFKGLCRWGEKSGTTIEYDTRKIIYYGVRIYKMLVGAEKTRAYLKELLEDKQFSGDK